ncbi:MAG TPA: hypothetical protein VGV59_11805 [Pyrinomonadaceae bacterium]|nr:hypothetical protein [Pyrinomonadaceae bacterium]
MKYLRMLVLLASVSVFTFGGNMDNGTPIPPPPPPPPSGMSTEEVITEPDGDVVPYDDADSFTDTLTGVLQSVLALF